MYTPDIVLKTSPLRRVFAAVVLIVGACVVAVGIYAVSNPQKYVVLFKYLRSPFASVFLIFLTLLIAWILAFPVTMPVEQRRRSQVRTTLIVLAIVSFLAFAFVGLLKVYRYSPEVLAKSPSGQREAALVQLYNTSELHIFSAPGLGQKDLGSFGVPCGNANSITVTFVSDTEIKISTPYNDYDFHLSPDGVPLQHFGAMCSG